ncbi:unnamed protein product [Phyllotreta striolata]|uniref:Uncharacterized protein n=1 Tax=Phyllotreta striolata TaxID=444603 RepID=A0A9N9TDX9_PHYSR|nr:unnamed protein product [Phyllotreta striolata]
MPIAESDTLTADIQLSQHRPQPPGQDEKFEKCQWSPYHSALSFAKIPVRERRPIALEVARGRKQARPIRLLDDEDPAPNAEFPATTNLNASALLNFVGGITPTLSVIRALYNRAFC